MILSDASVYERNRYIMSLIYLGLSLHTLTCTTMLADSGPVVARALMKPTGNYCSASCFNFISNWHMANNVTKYI